MAIAHRTRLEALDNSTTYDNPGLALQRYLKENGDNHESAKQLLKNVAASPVSSVYKAAFQRYRSALQDCATVELTLAAPMAVGLGISSPLEVGLTTIHTYGMPCIPGSAVKGICRDVGEGQQSAGIITKAQFEAVFGQQEQAGLCIFFDAWYVPDTAPGDKPFHRDVVTVHHPDYYQGKIGAWPTDFDDPNPVPFVVVKPGSKFLFAVRPPTCDEDSKRTAWITYLKQLVIHAMTTHGAGGKINAGYGWFERPADSAVAQASTDAVSSSNVEWQGVTLQYSPGNQEVSCAAPQRRAFGKIDKIEAPEELKERLKNKKRLQNATIQVEKEGNAWRIVRIEHAA